MGSLHVTIFLIVLSVYWSVVISLDTEPHQHRHSRSSATRFSHLDRLLNRLDKTYPSPSSSSTSTPSPPASFTLRNHRLRASTAQSFVDFDDEHRISQKSDNQNKGGTDESSFHNSLWDNADEEINNGFTESDAAVRTTPAVETAEEVDRRWSRILAMAKNTGSSSKDGDDAGNNRKEEEVVIDENDEEEDEEDEEDDEDDEEDDNEDDETVVKNTQSDAYDRRPHWAPRQVDYSSWKWENLGSKQSVDRMFQVYKSGLLKPESSSPFDVAQYEVFRHNKLMSREAQCRVPRPKVIRVSDMYPSTSILYVPPCTVLHQCADDTGCCSGIGQRCGPKYTKLVELYFYTTYIVSSHNRQRTSSSLKKLQFYNHTECECQDKMEDMMPRDSNQEYRRSDSRTSDQSCKCPSEYTVRHLANGSCTCDCFDKQRDCIKYKKGKEYFNHQDRLCIEMGTCQLPSCDFGVYLRRSGRCPRKHEKFRSWSAYH